MHARLIAAPESNYAFWDAAEAGLLERYISRCNQLALRFRWPSPFHENWENVTKALEYVTGHLRAMFEPVDDDTAPGRLFDLKRAMLQSRVVRAYYSAPPLTPGPRCFAPRRLADAPAANTDVVLEMHSRFVASTQARNWILAPENMRLLHEGCPLDEEQRGTVDRFVLESLKTAGAALDWQLTVVLGAITYARRFWARKWTCQRSRQRPHCPRVLLVTCMLISAKFEGATVPRQRRAAGRKTGPDVACTTAPAALATAAASTTAALAPRKSRLHDAVVRVKALAAVRPHKAAAPSSRCCDEELTDGIIEALRCANGIWYTTREQVLAFEVELLSVLAFELRVHHVHTYIKTAFHSVHVRVSELAWSIATELYASDLVFIHAPTDLAYAVLLAAHVHFNLPPTQAALVYSTPSAGDAAIAAVTRWIGEREKRRLAAVENHQGPAESPSSVPKQQRPSESARALACVLQLASGSSVPVTNKKFKLI